MAKNLILSLCGILLSGCAIKSHTLPDPPAIIFEPNATPAKRIRQVAYGEHQAWGGSFIDTSGAIRRYQVSEGQRTKLSDGQPAWERVMRYWQGSGGILELSPRQNCLMGDFDPNRCRAFAMDSAWSAVFVSYVMRQAGVTDFVGSPRHFDYIKNAYKGEGVYHHANPATTSPKVGDMLCYVRGDNGVVGFEGLINYLNTHDKWLTAHCDIVVDVHDDEVWLIGGNVMDTVMLRQMALKDGVIQLPTGRDDCHHVNKQACDFNRQNWAVLLKLNEI